MSLSSLNIFSDEFVHSAEPTGANQVPVFGKNTLKHTVFQFSKIANESSIIDSWMLAVEFMYLAMRGYHLKKYSYTPCTYNADREVVEDTEGYKDNSYVVGYTSLLLLGLPLISQKLALDYDYIEESDYPNNSFSIHKFCLLAVILPIELLRKAVSLLLTAAYAVTIAPIVVAAAKGIGSDAIDKFYKDTYVCNI